MTKPQRDNKPQKHTMPVQSLTSKPTRALPEMAPLLAQQATADPDRVNPGNLLNLQRFYGNRAMSGLIQTRRMEAGSSPFLQRSQEDGKADEKTKERYPSPAEFKKLVPSGDPTIEVWLKAAKDADTWQEQQHALTQVRDACDVWLTKYGDNKKDKEKSSITQSRDWIKELKRIIEVYEQPGSGSKIAEKTPEIGAGSTSQNLRDMGQEVGKGLSGALGGIGTQKDIYNQKNIEKGIMDEEGADIIANEQEVGEFEGVGHGLKAALGGYGIWSKRKDWKKQKADSAKGAAESLGGMAQGGTKIAKGIGIENIGDERALKEIKKISSDKLSLDYDPAKAAQADKEIKNMLPWKQVGDSGGAVASSLSMVAGLITFVQGCQKLKEANAAGNFELFQAGLDRVKEFTSVGQAGVKTGLNITKAATAGAAKTAISGMATASGVMGVVIGGIEFTRGLITVVSELSRQNNLKGSLSLLKQQMDQLPAKVLEVQESIKVNGPNMTQEELEKLKKDLERWQTTIQELQKFDSQMQAMRKIQNQRMEEGIFKMAAGGAAVVSGALLLSGVGAPIAIGVAAVGGIIALGKVGLGWRRNAASNRLTTTALHLTDDGQPKATPDPKAPDYRTMEKRIYKCYYTHLPEVMLEKTPPGLTEDQFLDIKRFAWSEKEDRVKSKETFSFNKAEDIPRGDNDQVRNKWLVLNDATGKRIKKEAPTGFSKAGLRLTASAHKSKAAMEANKNEVIAAIYDLGSGSWDGKGFVDTPIVPEGADPKTIQQYAKTLTSKALLSAAGIDAKRWQMWLAQSTKAIEAENKKRMNNKDEQEKKEPLSETEQKKFGADKMKELIKKKIG